MVAPLIVAGARAGASVLTRKTGASQASSQTAGNGVRNVRKVLKTGENVYSMFGEAANDSRYDSIDQKKLASYNNQSLREQIKGDLEEKRAIKSEERGQNFRLRQKRSSRQGLRGAMTNRQKQLRDRETKETLIQKAARKTVEKARLNRAVLITHSISATLFSVQFIIGIFYLLAFMLKASIVLDVALYVLSFGLTSSEELAALCLGAILGLVLCNVIISALILMISGGAKPFTGKGTSLKYSALFMVALSAAVPVLNLFPFISGWIWVVKKYPE